MTFERWAAIVIWAYVAGFGLPAIPIARHLLIHGELPMFLNLFRTYGGPWSTRTQPPTFVVLLGMYFLVTMLVAVGAWQLWNGRRSGAIIVLAAAPIEAIFWYGFALPIPPMLAPIRVGLVVAAWRSLS